jgi:hypothetical protein
MKDRNLTKATKGEGNATNMIMKSKNPHGKHMKCGGNATNMIMKDHQKSGSD